MGVFDSMKEKVEELLGQNPDKVEELSDTGIEKAGDAIDQATGEPRRIQNVDPLTHHVRTFSIDPSGRLLVAASIRDMWTRYGNEVRLAPAGWPACGCTRGPSAACKGTLS